MITSAYLYRAPHEVEGLYERFLGGIYLLWGLPTALQLGVVIAFLTATFACVKRARGAGSIWEWVAWGAGSLAFVASTLLCFVPWDELFTNLRHAEHFAEGFGFSYNRTQAIEGSVDFLFYVLVGAAKKVGVAPVNGAFFLSVAGGWLVIAAFRQAARYLDRPELVSPVTVALCFFPPLLFNAASGFSATCFAAAILWGVVLALRGPLNFGLVLVISLVPLIRFEGFLWPVVFWSWYWLLFKPKHTPRFWGAAMGSLLPGLALGVWRYLTFGTLVPLPAAYKATIQSPFFWGIGAMSFLSDFVSSTAAACVFGLLLFRANEQKKLHPWLTALGALGIFVLPYYATGGDWFPTYWGRFLLPFTLGAFFLTLVLIADAAKAKQWIPLTLLVAAFALPLFWPLYSPTTWGQTTFGFRRLMASPRDASLAKALSRVHYLAQLGNHLKKTTDPSDVVASSELSTIMYFAEREALDLLGVANPEIAHQPLRPAPSLWRRLNHLPDLPYRIFRRQMPGLLEKYRPAFLFTFDFWLRDLAPDLSHFELDEISLTRALRRWERQIGGLVTPLYGGFNRILELGYTPVFIVYPNQFCSLYFVHAAALARHRAAMEKQGMTGKWLSLQSHVK